MFVLAAILRPRAQSCVRAGASIAWRLALLLSLLPAAAHAQDAAQAAQRPPVTIPLFLSSRTDQCHDSGEAAAIRALATMEQTRINASGGIAGHPVRLSFLDDRRETGSTIANLRAAVADPSTIAMIGLSSSNRAKPAFDALGRQIAQSAIPFLSNITVNSIFAPYPNVFTTRASQNDESIPVMAAFIRSMQFQRPSFVGRQSSIFSAAIGDRLKVVSNGRPLVADHRLGGTAERLDAAGLDAAVADLKQKQTDVVVLSVGTSRAGDVLQRMQAAGLTPSVFLMGSIDRLPPQVKDKWPNAIYQLTWDALPDAYNDRLRKRIFAGEAAQWVFAGARQPAAPGWATGACKERPPADRPDPLTPENLRAIGIGTQFADMVALVAAAARGADPKADIGQLRRHIAAQLTSTYAAGKGAFKGSFDNWSFDPASRAAVRTPLVTILPQGLGRTQLAPIQFVRVKDGSLRQIDTLYADIDLIKTYRVDDNEKTFFAQFYLSMHAGSRLTIEQIEFTNAYLDPRTNGRQVTVEVLHGGGQSASFPAAMRIYKISGRFVFEPNLASYPLDSQRFSIDIQPRRGDDTFIVQPPPGSLRDRQVEADGWTSVDQYVGYDADFVPVINAFTHDQSVVPFYKASYVWLMQRQTTDYLLRVLVPLAFILVVAYVSIFIPLSHFEAIVTIQVTALLSAVALYLSLPKLDSDTATLSDRIFVFDYMMVSLMILISVLRVNRTVAAHRWLRLTFGAVHVVLVPLLVLAMSIWVMGQTPAFD